MEDINQRLETLAPKKQEQFQKILARETRRISPKTEAAKQEVIELTKSIILHYLTKEEQEKITARKHGSKGKKHRERGPEQVKRIEKKLEQYKINYVALLKELFNVDLREKHSYNGIRYIGLCPFHEEKTPSLSVAADKGVIKCYGCGKGHRPIYLISNVFKVKYSRALGMLEKYIFTPEEDEDRRKKNEAIRDMFQTTSEQIDRHTFARSRRDKAGYYGNPPYLSKKQFNEEFIKRKEEQDLKEKEKEARLKKTTNSNDDDLAF